MSVTVTILNNTCPICYSGNLKAHYCPDKSDVEIFSCKHFTCKDCFKKIKNNFSCPICRKEGNKYLKTFGSNDYENWNALSQWVSNFNVALNMFPKRRFNSGFGKIYTELKDDFFEIKEQRKKNKILKIKANEKKMKKQQRQYERNNSQCYLCKTKCTSKSQLRKHINSKTCKKRQKKQSLLK